ncbi:MAG: HAD family phosphatase [bacterium]|nr:HAD family phosphatase [bacterium]
MKKLIKYFSIAFLILSIPALTAVAKTTNGQKKDINYKLIVSDVDSTLIPDGSKLIPKKSVEAIEEAIQNHVNIAFVSGRPYESVKQSLLEGGIPATTLKNIIISGLNGAEAYKNNKLIFEQSIPNNISNNIIKYCSKLNVNVAVITSNNFYMLRKDNWAKLYEKRLHYKKAIIPVKPNTTRILKMVIMSPYKNTELKNKIDRYLQQYTKDINTIRAIPQFKEAGSPCEWVEVMPNNVDKGSATRKLSKYLNIPLSSVICIGDASNDYAMLKIPEVMSIVVGNTKYPELKKIVKFVANPVNGNPPGFAQMINKFIIKTKSE